MIPREIQRKKLRESPRQLEVYDEPMALVVEVWSPSTGAYDVEEKLREYQLRRDREIWRLHPYDRQLTAWPVEAGGAYDEAVYRAGEVRPAALRNVSIELETLFPG